MKTKLIWKKLWCDDKSGCWYSAKVPVLGWEYVIDVCETKHIKDCKMSYEYKVGLFYSSKNDDVAKISKTSFKTEARAKLHCEKHLLAITERFNKWFKAK
jgi:hypothetical protein